MGIDLGGFGSYKEAFEHIRKDNEQRNSKHREEEKRRSDRLSLRSYVTQVAFKVDDGCIWTALFGAFKDLDDEYVRSLFKQGETGYYVLLYKTECELQEEDREYGEYGEDLIHSTTYVYDIRGKWGSYNLSDVKWVSADVASSITDGSSFTGLLSSLYGGEWKEGYCNDDDNEEYLMSCLAPYLPSGGEWDIENGYDYEEGLNKDWERIDGLDLELRPEGGKKHSNSGIGYVCYEVTDFDKIYTRYDAFYVDKHPDTIYAAVLLSNGFRGTVRIYSIEAYEKHVALTEEGWTKHTFCEDYAETNVIKTYECPKEVLDSMKSNDDFAEYMRSVISEDWVSGKYYSLDNANDISDIFYGGEAKRGSVYDGYNTISGYYVSWEDGFYDYTLDY